MGLRETNAARTKMTIVDAAIELILERGYDSTTMEDIARHADVGTSTLYRYFPTKESVVVGVLGDAELMAQTLRGRPGEEPPEEALGHAIVSFLDYADQDRERGEKVSEVIENNARPRARMLEWLGDMHKSLVIALEERIDGPDAALRAGAMAWTAVYVLQESGEASRRGVDQRGIRTIAEDIMATLARHELRTPRL